jgi:hypothetical protein
MKISILIPSLFAAFSVFGQAVVNFSNNVLSQPPDRLVRYIDGITPLVGTNWCAQLYYGRDADSLSPVAAPPRRFRDASTTPPGIWNGAMRTLDGFAIGEIATLQVRVWDSTLFEDFDSAIAAGAIHGRSVPFAYVVPPPLSQSEAFYMENFQGFSLIPEPNVVLLGLVGAVLLVLRRRG